jgi:hypothetical protein
MVVETEVNIVYKNIAVVFSGRSRLPLSAYLVARLLPMAEVLSDPSNDPSLSGVKEDEIIKTIHATNSTKAATNEEITNNFTENEDAAVADDGGVVGNNNRGDEGVMEGVAIGNADEFSSDSEDEVSGILGVMNHY